MSDMSEQTQNEDVVAEVNDSSLAETAQIKLAVELPGKRLTEVRTEQQLSLEEVSSHLHLDVQIIIALEEDDYSKLPSATYICGYLRSYARLLKLPEDELVAAYNKGEEINASLIPENVNIVADKTVNGVVLKVIGLALLLFLISAGLFWVAERFDLFNTAEGETSTNNTDVIELNENSDTQNESVIAAPLELQSSDVRRVNESNDAENSTAADVNDSATNESFTVINESTSDVANVSEMSNADIIFNFSGACWTEVVDSSGTRLLWKRVEKGSVLSVGGVPPYKILLGKADAVEITYKGDSFDHLAYAKGDIAYFTLGN